MRKFMRIFQMTKVRVYSHEDIHILDLKVPSVFLVCMVCFLSYMSLFPRQVFRMKSETHEFFFVYMVCFLSYMSLFPRQVFRMIL